MARKRRGRGEGSIEELPSGKFRVVLSAGKGPDGKRRKLTETFATKREAMDWRDEQRALLRKGVAVGGAKRTVADWLAQWLEVIRPTKANNSWTFYEFHVRTALVPRLGPVRLGEVTADRIERMYADLLADGMSADAVRKAGTTLGAALQKAVKNRLIPFNPARDADKPAPGHAPRAAIRVLDPDQVAQFLRAAREDRLYALYVLWLDSGARTGELFGLQWGDVDWCANSIQVVRSVEEKKGRLGPGEEALRYKDVKTKKSRRRVALSAFTMGALAEHRKSMLAEGRYAPDAPVFCAPEGGLLRKSNFQRRSFNKILARAGLPHFRPYDLRHSSATLLLLANEPAKVVSERLGHSSVTLTLDTYSHVLPGMQERAAAKLGAILRGVASEVERAGSPTAVPQATVRATG
jgi:integrase